MTDKQTHPIERAIINEEDRNRLIHDVLVRLNRPSTTTDTIRDVLKMIQNSTGVDAVGIRIRVGDDFPYYTQDGFTESFLRTENSLLARNQEGLCCKNKDGSTCLECTCGLVLSGKTDPANPLFTEQGSFWTNNSLPLLDLPADQDPRLHPRNRCIQDGFRSIALIPLRANDEIMGLLQLNDHRPGLFTLELIRFLEGLATSLAMTLKREQAEEALRESELLLKESQIAAGLGSYVLDLSTGLWRSSAELDRLFGIDQAYERSVDGWTALIHPADRAMMTDYFQNEVLGQRQTFDKEYRIIRHSDQAVRWVHGLGKLKFNAKKRPLKLYGTIQDITDRKRDEAEQEKLQAQLVQALKLESVGRLAGGMAHDFNNLLMGIMGFTDLCRDQLPANHPAHCYLDEITDASQRSAALIQQLLAFARKQVVTPKVIDLNDAVASMLKLLQRMVGENISLVWKPGTGLWQIKIDPTQIDQILANLCINARDAITDIGQLAIKTTNATIDDSLCADHRGITPGEYVLLEISDDGCGMEKDMLDHIFEPFFTTKGIGKGTGLGLATVYGIVTQNRGGITVDSEPGKGTTFRIFLPRSVQESTESLAANTVIVPQSQGETVLLVEDEHVLRKMCEQSLKKLGYTTLTAASPEEAIDIAARHPDTIHLLLTDVIMPGMNGWDLAQKILLLLPRIKCLFMSGYAANVITPQGLHPENMSFIQKPFSRTDLARKVREVLKETS